MRTTARLARLALVLATLLVPARPNQVEDIPHNDVKNWALKFGVDLWEFGRHFTKMNQIQNKYHEYNVEVARKDGLLLIRELAAEVKNHMDFKKMAVMRLTDCAEQAALSGEGGSATGARGGSGGYYDARWLNVHAGDGTLAARARTLALTPSRHFDGLAVNTSYSAVLMPPYISENDGEVQSQIAWSEHLDPLFVNNYESDPTLSWQYYGSSTGFLRRYPAMSWPPEDGYSHHARDFYDFRSSSWFVEAATSPKDLVILLDDSADIGSYRHLARATVSALIDTLGPNDFVNVYRYNDAVTEIHPCFTKVLAQATPENVREMKTALWAEEPAPAGAANLSAAFTVGFEILQRYNRTGQGCQCNQAIAVVGAGGGAGGVKGVFRTWNWPHMPVRILAYRVGGDAAAGAAMQDMACSNKGFYVTINDHSEIKHKVFHYVGVMARPMVMYQLEHPVHWSPVYIGGRGSSLADDGHGQLMTSVTMPIFDRRNHTQREANLLGVVGTDVPVDQIKKLVPPYKLGVNGYSFMVDNNGHLLYHPDLRPLHTNEEYTETLRPLYSNVDVTDVELLVDPERDSRNSVNLTSLLLDLRHDMIEQREGETEIGVKVHYDEMRRVSTRRQRYFHSPIDGTPFSLAIVLPDGYGMYELLAEQEIKRSPVNVSDFFKGDNWKVHPDWVYCEYSSGADQTFSTPEEQMLHFLARATRPGWKWMSLRPRYTAMHNKKQERDSYFCDKTLMQSLVRDAMVIKELDGHSGHASHHNHPIATLMALLSRQGYEKFGVVLSFIATRSGLLRWTETNNTRASDTSELHFSEKYKRAFDAEWYRRAVEHHAIEPESFVFSVPFTDESSPPSAQLVLATHAVFVESRGHRAPAAVVGLHFQLDTLSKHFLNVTSTCTINNNCKKTCAMDDLDCYILDDNGFIILSENMKQTGRFFGQIDGTIMDSLVQDKIYKKVPVYDYQGRCPDGPNPFSAKGSVTQPIKPMGWLGKWLANLLTVWFPLWDTVSARAGAYAQEDIDAMYDTDYETDVEEEDGERGTYQIIIDPPVGLDVPAPAPLPPGPPPVAPGPPAHSSATLRPCDTRTDLFQLQSARLNASQPLKGKLTNCHNTGCERPFSVQKIPHSNLILLVVDTLCPCGSKRLDVKPQEVTRPAPGCRRPAHPPHRRRHAKCINYHPEEIEIQSCGKGSQATRAFWIIISTITFSLVVVT